MRRYSAKKMNENATAFNSLDASRQLIQKACGIAQVRV